MADLMSLISRRNMIVTMAGGAAATGTYLAKNGTGFSAISANAFFGKQKVTTKKVRLATAEVADWRGVVGTFFTLETGQVLQLGSVAAFADPDGPPPDPLRKKAFVARFNVVPSTVARAQVLPEPDRIYRIAHPRGGTFDIYLSAGDPAQPEQRLAVFS